MSDLILLAIAAAGLIWLLFSISGEKSKTGRPDTSPKPKETSGRVADPQKLSWIDKKGQAGEQEVGRILARLPRQEYIVLNDVLLPAQRGTTQIDHVVVSIYGIFVIESKNYTGKIYGTHDSEKWSQYINGEEYHFRNPIKQNIGHVMAVKRLVNLPGEYIIPLVVFTGSATLKVLDCEEVVYDGMLYETICRRRERLLSSEQMERFARILDGSMEENAETKSAHVEQVRERLIQWDAEVNAGLCPRCDGRLVLRKGKYGLFYGCSNYPRCKYTRKIENE